MLTFLNTSILAVLAVITIPLIIHLITRQKVKKIYFSSLIFLKELRTQKIRRIKIRQILLLIIRTLIILLLVLAFARPTLKGKLSSTVHSKAKTSAVIIFDNSLSMGREIEGKVLLDEAKEKLTELQELFRVGDEIYSLFLTPGSSSIYHGARYDFKDVEQIILNTEVSHRTTDVLSSLIKAKNILQQSENINKEIYLISDLQQTGFKKLQQLQQPILDETNIKLFVIPCTTGKLSNLGIIKIDYANQLIEKGKVFELDVVIKNFGAYAERDKLIQLFIEGKRSAQGTVDLKPGESQKFSFKIVPDRTGLLTGSVLLEDDNLSLDNRRYFMFYVPDRIKVLLVGGKAEDIKFLKLALKISPNVEITDINLNKINYDTFINYDIVVFSNIPRLNDSLGAKLLDYVKQGGGLIVFLGSDVDLKSYNSNFNREFSLPIFTGTVGEIDNRNSFLTFGKIDYSHPIFKGMFEQNKGQIESPKFYFAVNAKDNTFADNIIELSNNSPFLSERKINKGKVLLFFTAMDAQWSDFYVKGIFAPLINRSIIYLAGIAEKAGRTIFVDKEITTVVQNIGEHINFKMKKPNGSFISIKPQIEGSFYNISFQQTNLMGTYTLYSNDKKIDKWAVNYWPDESNVDPIPENKLTEIIGKNNITFVKKNKAIKNTILITRYGRELWQYFIAVALILLFLEMMIGRESNIAITQST